MSVFRRSNAREDNASLRAGDAVAGAVFAAACVAADNARIVQLHHRRIAAEAACNVGNLTVPDCRIFRVGENVCKDNCHVAARDQRVHVRKLPFLDDTVCRAVVHIGSVPQAADGGVNAVPVVRLVDVCCCGQRLCHGEFAVRRECRRARAVCKGICIGGLHIGGKPLVRRDVLEVVVVGAGGGKPGLARREAGDARRDCHRVYRVGHDRVGCGRCAEVGNTVAVAELLEENRAVVLVVCMQLCMIDRIDFLAVGRGHKNRRAGGENLVFVIAALHRLRLLLPGGGCKQIRLVGQLEKTRAVVVAVRIVCGIGDVERAVLTVDRVGSLDDVIAFPGFIRGGNGADAALEGGGGLQLADDQCLLVALCRVVGSRRKDAADVVACAVVLKDTRAEPGPDGCVQPFHCADIGECALGHGGGALQHHRLALCGGRSRIRDRCVEIPCAVKAVELRRPDALDIGGCRPDDGCRRVPEVGKVCRAGNQDAGRRADGRRTDVVVPAVGVADARVCAVADDRILEFDRAARRRREVNRRIQFGAALAGDSCVAADVADGAEVAARNVQRVDAVKLVLFGVLCQADVAVEAAARDIQRDIAVYGAYILVHIGGGRHAVDAAVEVAARNGHGDAAVMAVLARTADVAVEVAARDGDAAFADRLAQRLAAAACAVVAGAQELPCAALHGDVGGCFAERTVAGRGQAIAGVDADIGGHAAVHVAAADDVVAEHNLVAAAEDGGCKAAALHRDMLKQRFAAECENAGELDFRAVFAEVLAAEYAGDSYFSIGCGQHRVTHAQRCADNDRAAVTAERANRIFQRIKRLLRRAAVARRLAAGKDDACRCLHIGQLRLGGQFCAVGAVKVARRDSLRVLALDLAGRRAAHAGCGDGGERREVCARDLQRVVAADVGSGLGLDGRDGRAAQLAAVDDDLDIAVIVGGVSAAVSARTGNAVDRAVEDAAVDLEVVVAVLRGKAADRNHRVRLIGRLAGERAAVDNDADVAGRTHRALIGGALI